MATAPASAARSWTPATSIGWPTRTSSPALTTPDDSYHGVTYAKDFGKGAFITKATAQLMRDFGSTPAPMNSWIMGMHLESLAVRMQRHCENAQKVAEFLNDDPRVSWVQFPGLPGDKYYGDAQKYMPNGTCGVISFGVPGGRDKSPRCSTTSR